MNTYTIKVINFEGQTNTHNYLRTRADALTWFKYYCHEPNTMACFITGPDLNGSFHIL